MVEKILLLHDDETFCTRLDGQDSIKVLDIIRPELVKMGYTVELIPFKEPMDETMNVIRKFAPDLVFNMVETWQGSGALGFWAASLLEHMNIPFTGCPSSALFLAGDKIMAKRQLNLGKVRTPEGFSFEDIKSGAAILKNKRYIIKSRREHSSVGLTEDCVVSPKDFPNLIERMQKLAPEMGGACLIEEYIPGREIYSAVLSGQILPFEEIFFKKDSLHIFDFASKWCDEDDHSTNFEDRLINPKMSAGLRRKIIDATNVCVSLFELKGYARVDFRIAEDETPYVIDINPNPCIFKDSGFSLMAEKGGYPYTEFLKKILEEPINTVRERKENAA